MADERKVAVKEKVSEVDEILKYFEQEEIDLDQAIEKYEKAMHLVKDIEKTLKEYELRIEKIKKSNE